MKTASGLPSPQTDRIHIKLTLKTPTEATQNFKEEQQMKNLKVGKKFLLAFGLILAMFLIAVVSAGVGIRRSKASYRSMKPSPASIRCR